MTDMTAYLNAVRDADLTVIARWRTSTCPECEELVRGDGTDTGEYLIVRSEGRRHVLVNSAVAVGCQGYQVISPAALGLDPGDWDDWTEGDYFEVTPADWDDGGGPAECPKHGQVNVMDWGGFSGFAGGACYYAQLSCGCYDVDESNDVRAAM